MAGRQLLIWMAVVALLLPAAACRRRPRANLAGDAAAGQIPGNINAAQTSSDPSYGYNRETPIQIGSPDPFDRDTVKQVYVRRLRDGKFQPFRSKNMGDAGKGPDGHRLTKYALTDSDERRYTIYVDPFHPDIAPIEAMAPKGMFFARE